MLTVWSLSPQAIFSISSFDIHTAVHSLQTLFTWSFHTVSLYNINHPTTFRFRTMPSFKSLALLSFTAAGNLAAPAEKRWNDKCLSDYDAQTVATNYGTLIESYSDSLANAVLSENFTDYSESVNTLINSCPQGDAGVSLPLLAPTFSDRASFEKGQGQQPSINFKQLNIWHTCDTVIIRWETTNTANITDVKPIVGLITMETCQAPSGSQYPFLIDTVYSEFDAGAWLQNLVEGGICTTNAGLPPASSSSPSASSTATWAPTSTKSSSSSSWTPSSSTSSSWHSSSASVTSWLQSSTSTPVAYSTTTATENTSTVWQSTTSYTTQTAYATATVWSA